VRFLVTGASGLLGGWLVDVLGAGGDPVIACRGPRAGDDRSVSVDLAEPGAADALVTRTRPDVILHAAALAAIADCAADPDRARRINVDATARLARAAATVGARLVHVSTDLVFDGEAAPYDEAAVATPLSIYGRTKLEAEAAAALAPSSVIVRVSLLFGPTRTARRGFFDAQVEALRAGAAIRAFDDEWRTPLSLLGAAETLVAIARSNLTGLVHAGGHERLSRLEMARALAALVGASSSRIEAVSRTSVPGEPRPVERDVPRARLDARLPGLRPETFADACRRMGLGQA